MPEQIPARGAYEDFQKTEDYARASEFGPEGFKHMMFAAGWNAALHWVPMEIGKIRELCGLPGGRSMSGFVAASELLPTEKQILEDEERVNSWVESLNADTLYEALVERLAERVNMEESEIKALLLEIHARMKTLEEVGVELEDIANQDSGVAERITPVETPA